MKIPFRKIKQDFTAVRFSSEEKAGVLKSINLYMAENPLERQGFSFNLFIRKNYMIPAIIIALLLATSGGTVAAAENSLPGDMLYGVKLQVNERMMSALAVSDDAEADVQSKLAERRLQEFNKMIEIKEWSAEKEQKMADRLAEYQTKTLALIERLRTAGKNELADSIYDRMVAKENSHEEFVAMIKNASSEDVKTKLAERMKEMRSKVDAADEIVKTPEGLKVSAEQHIQNAKDAITQLAKVYDEQKATLSDRLKTYMESSLAEAQSKLAEAEAKYAILEYQPASDLAKDAMHIAIKARNFSSMIENAGELVSEKKLEKMEVHQETKNEPQDLVEQKKEEVKQSNKDLQQDSQDSKETLREDRKEQEDEEELEVEDRN